MSCLIFRPLIDACSASFLYLHEWFEHNVHLHSATLKKLKNREISLMAFTGCAAFSKYI